MPDENTQAEILEKEIDALLVKIQEGDKKLAEASAALEQLDRDVEAFEKETEVVDAEIEKVGNAAGDELSNFAQMIEKEMEAEPEGE